VLHKCGSYLHAMTAETSISCVQVHVPRLWALGWHGPRLALEHGAEHVQVPHCMHQGDHAPMIHTLHNLS
jgi:hypothetical protein